MVLKLVGFCCSVESGWLIGNVAKVGVVQGWGRIFAEVLIEEILEGTEVRQRTISCGLIFSLCSTFFHRRFKFSNVDFLGIITTVESLSPRSTSMSVFFIF